MKKIALLFVSVLIVMASVAQKQIIVNGKIDNCKNPRNSYIRKEWFNPATSQVESKNYSFSIAEDGTFRVKFSEPDNYFYKYWIYLGNEMTQLHLTQGDSIYMTLDGNMFDETIKYSGRGAGRNNYQRDMFLEFWDTDIRSEIDNRFEPEAFLADLNSFSDRRTALLNKYMQAGEIEAAYFDIEKSMILNERANHVLNHYNLFHNHKDAPKNVAAELDNILKSAVFTDDKSLQHDPMRELVYSMPLYMVEHPGKSTESKLKAAIKWAKANYSSTMNRYFDLQLISNNLNNAKSIDERNTLIAFFDKQFDDPILKRGLQELKNQTGNMVSAGTQRIATGQMPQMSMLGSLLNSLGIGDANAASLKSALAGNKIGLKSGLNAKLKAPKGKHYVKLKISWDK